MNFLENKKVILTGASSMMGHSVYKYLSGKCTVYPITHRHTDLMDSQATLKLFNRLKADYCIHLAGYNGNIIFNQKYPAEIYHRTTQIGLNVLHSCLQSGVKKIVSLISSCAYPDLGNQLLSEGDFWNGPPNSSVDAHGFAKRTLLEYSKQLAKEYDIVSVGMIVNTGYGPNDNYDVEKTKVIGGLINKIATAKRNKDKSITCWGTGKPKREFVYCDDVGKHLLLVLANYDNSNEPINIGSGMDYTIKQVVDTIAEKFKFTGEILWTNKNDGQMRKLLDNSKMNSLFGHLQFTSLSEGLDKTIEWYETFYNNSLDKNT